MPYLWIIGYLAASAVIANVGVSTTEYSAALFAGNVGMTAVVLPYLFYQILSLVLGSVSGLINNLCEARMDRNLRRMVWRKTVSLPLRFYEKANPPCPAWRRSGGSCRNFFGKLRLFPLISPSSYVLSEKRLCPIPYRIG